jgi:flagellar FliL protein
MEDNLSNLIAEPQGPPPPERPGFVVFLAGAVALGGVVAGLALFLRAQIAGPFEAAVDPSVILAAVQGTPPVAAGGAAKAKGSSQIVGETFALDTFVVNISDKERDRYLKIATELELTEPGTEEELAQRLPQIRDLIISLLASKSFDDVRTIEGKNFLREEILLRVNALLTTGSVKRVFFTEFVVQ